MISVCSCGDLRQQSLQPAENKKTKQEEEKNNTIIMHVSGKELLLS